jgi:hypothetical protein
LVGGEEGVGQDVRCPSCEQQLTAPVGRFAGIVNVVVYVAALDTERRTAFLDHPDEHVPGGWFAQLDDDSALFWRRCLVHAIYLLQVPAQRTESANLVAIARAVARQVSANRSFTPQRD